jgi:hypothetical protein
MPVDVRGHESSETIEIPGVPGLEELPYELLGL